MIEELGTQPPIRVPIHRDLLTGSLSDMASVRLSGTRCRSCHEVAFGTRPLCPNCGRDTIDAIALSDRGILWTYTVVRHRPPGNYKGPDPFVPFGLGLVELPEGVRVMSPLACPIEQLRVGLELRFEPQLRRDADGREVVAFSFVPAADGRPR